MENRRKNFAILFKPTHKCNFKCEYCHDRVNRDKVGDVEASEELLKHTLKLLEDFSEEVVFIWHGGEPTTMGTEYYDKVQDEFYYRYRTKFNQSLQSNGSLLNQDWMDLMKKTGIDIGVSNDILTQEIRVGKEYSLEKLNKLFMGNEQELGVITVINGENTHLMTEILKKACDMGIVNLSMNMAYNPSATKKLPEHLDLNPDKYGVEFRRMLDTWLHNEMNIRERSICQKISLTCGISDRITCTYGDCRMNWIGVGPTGKITFCDRDMTDEFNFGNIMDMESIEDYHNTEGFKKFYNEVQYRLDNVCSKCEIYNVCGGGCNANHLSANGSLRKNDETRCDCIKNALKETYDLMRNIDLRDCSLSETANKYLREIDFLPLVEIKEFLMGKGLDINKLEYNKDKYTECSEFKLFKLFNPNRVAIDNKHSDNIVYLKSSYTKSKEEKYNDRKKAIDNIYSNIEERILNIIN